MDFFIVLLIVSATIASSGYLANLMMDKVIHSSTLLLAEPMCFISLLSFGIILILSSSYFIILYILYFIVGYLFCLKYFPHLNEDDYGIEFDSLDGIALVFNIVIFWPFYVLTKSIKTINFSKFFKTPISEWKKENKK